MLCRRLGAAVAACVMFTGFLGGPAHAQEANVRASCEGIVSSRISPPGSFAPVPGGRAQIAELTRTVTAPSLGFKSPGGYTSYFAHFHGSEIGPECS